MASVQLINDLQFTYFYQSVVLLFVSRVFCGIRYYICLKMSEGNEVIGCLFLRCLSDITMSLVGFQNIFYFCPFHFIWHFSRVEHVYQDFFNSICSILYCEGNVLEQLMSVGSLPTRATNANISEAETVSNFRWLCYHDSLNVNG